MLGCGGAYLRKPLCFLPSCHPYRSQWGRDHGGDGRAVFGVWKKTDTGREGEIKNKGSIEKQAWQRRYACFKVFGLRLCLRCGDAVGGKSFLQHCVCGYIDKDEVCKEKKMEGISKSLTVFLKFFKDKQKYSFLWYDALHNEEILKKTGTFGEKFRPK